MNFKRWIPLVAAFGLMVMVVGVASGASNVKHKTRTLTRACFWVETKGDKVTYHDVKISKLNRTDVRFCIAGKPGAKGKSVRGVAGLVGPVGSQGAQGAKGETGSPARRVKPARRVRLVSPARRVTRVRWAAGPAGPGRPGRLDRRPRS